MLFSRSFSDALDEWRGTLFYRVNRGFWRMMNHCLYLEMPFWGDLDEMAFYLLLHAWGIFFAFCLVEWKSCLECWRNPFCFMSCWLTALSLNSFVRGAGGICFALCLVDWLFLSLNAFVWSALLALCLVHERLFILLLFDETFWSDLAERLFLPFIMPFGVLGLGWL